MGNVPPIHVVSSMARRSATRLTPRETLPTIAHLIHVIHAFQGITAGEVLMSSSPNRLRAGYFILTVVVMIAVLAMQRTTSFAADKPADVKGPAITSNSDKTPSTDNSTQPESTTKSHKSAEQEKKADKPSKKVAKPEKKEPEKKDEPKKAAAASPIVSPSFRTTRMDR
jgi:outer membrane biosynthesis protein TonB